MASSALIKPISMAETSCVLTSIPTLLFTSSKTINSKFPQILSTPFTSKPCNLTWACAKNRNLSSFKLLVPFVAQTTEGEVEVEVEKETAAETVVEDGDENGAGGEMLYGENPEDAKIFVGNLPYDVDSEALAQLFNQVGVVEIAEVIYNRETDQSRGFGFVTMSTVEEAEKAVEKFSQHEINGRVLTVNMAGPRGSPRPERTPRIYAASYRLYVGNLAWQVDDSRLEQVFSEHGKVVDARVVYDRETQRSRGFGFVTMSNETEVNDAIGALDGQSLDGRTIKVNVAEERPRRNSF